MKPEDKKLLLQDLCARLPYHVIVKYRDANVDLTKYVRSVKIEECKPYLRPMSSMTEEERKEYELLANHCIVTSIGFIHLEVAPFIDWLNAHHFDYRGLIKKGFAIEVTEENNPYKE